MFPIIDIKVDSRGKQVLRDLDKLTNDIKEVVEKESMNIAVTFNREITDYPPPTDGNQPPTPYYARGRGYVRSNGVHPLSEQFGENVTHKIRSTPTEVEIEFNLKPSYSNWLVGSIDQAKVHARNGWKTIRMVLRGLNIDADETTNSNVPATLGMRNAIKLVSAKFSKYS